MIYQWYRCLSGYRHRWVVVLHRHIWRTLCENCGFMFNHTRKPWRGVLADRPLGDC
jgi:hypothetical protein